MRDDILSRLSGEKTATDKYNVLREYLQCLTLKFIEEKGYIKNIAFVGGTALRFLFEIKRFSEDLDFSLINRKGFDFEVFLKELEAMFGGWNIGVELVPKIKKTVQSAFLKFPNLMHVAGISQRENQKLLIKLEIDTTPPAGYKTAVSFNNKYLPLNILHYDEPSLFSGKLHAVLLRQYTKGRDIYDLIWFLGRKVLPNYPLLENAIFQTTNERLLLDKKNLKVKLLKRILDVDFKMVKSELESFLADRNELKYMTREVCEQMIEKL